ncbi:right-handed parallel beta-helix repeat-containing protein [Arthrobacter sp. C9C5]|uniref:right-handed parallel beta-helix repeat-containing protein n=1 Tax=Arthrobacter sp. C9C5 TaxID=2735267 RepID=UPI001584DAC0|nr:right-handed parallel beta-helix repeat-containing protein [Arthrobacter sp. C9C5]NUU30041.1 right-handed parallel beta-helix repeat-containing protein [Arthrobacter sp. C9C5]
MLLSGSHPIRAADREQPRLDSKTGVDELVLNPKNPPFNAEGDGLTDDTVALQAWLNAGGSLLAEGSFRITHGLTLDGDGRTLNTMNAKIVADGVDITALTVTGNNSRVSVYVNGNNKAAYGLRVTGSGSVIENGRYVNFRSVTQSARGIDITTTGGALVRNNVVRNVVSLGDKTRGNGPGFSRGIGLNARGPASAESYISNNLIENITGEEGDAIHVLFYDGMANPFNSGKVTISDNTIRNVSRRFIKVQASDVAVERNKLNFDLPSAPKYPSSAIDVIRSQDVRIIGNEINPNLIGNDVAVNGTSTAPLRGIQISDNVLRQTCSKKSVNIYLKWTSSPVVRNNVVHGGGTGLGMDSSTNALLGGNTFRRRCT